MRASRYRPGVLAQVHHIVDVVLVDHKVDAQQAGVAVGGVEGLEAVAQVLLRHQVSQAAAQVLQVMGKERQSMSDHNQSEITIAERIVVVAQNISNLKRATVKKKKRGHNCVKIINFHPCRLLKSRELKSRLHETMVTSTRLHL